MRCVPNRIWVHMFDLFRQRSRRLWQRLTHPGSLQQRNVRNVLVDGIGVGIVTGVATFLPVFLARLGASPLTVGLLTSMPALTGMFLTIPLGRFLERQPNIVPWYSRARVLVFACYALTGLAALLLPPGLVAAAIILIWALATVPQTIVTVAFTVVMGAVAGPDQRYYLMSRRWSVLGAATAIAVALAGGLLELLPFPLNYQVVFIASFAGGMLSFAFSRQISIPDNQAAASASREQRSWRAQLREGLVALRENPAYSRFLVSQCVFNFGLLLAQPLFPLYWVRQLHAPDAWIGAINTVNNGVLLVAYFLWAEISHRRGAQLVLRLCSLGLVLYPVLTGLTHSVPPMALYAGLAGVFAAGLNLVLFDILLNTCPPGQTASYVALYQFTINVVTLLAPLLGTLLAQQLGYTPALLISGALRLAGFSLFVVLNVGGMPSPRQAAR